MLTLIENGEIYAPEPQGRRDLLLVNDKIAKIGSLGRQAVKALGLELDVIDATGCVVAPGLIDPHQHLTGGSGERGFSSQTPELYASEIVAAGITTVVGCLGVDTSMKTMAGLLAKAKGLREEGLSGFIWSGGYNVPPTTITGRIRDDIMFISEVIGAGEVAIADARSTEPTPHELARLVSDAHVGGMLSRKAGVTHFHVGEGKQRLALLRTLIDEYGVEPGWLYPTHVERDETLMSEAVDLTKRGAFVDIDTVEEDLPKWLRYYLDNDGDPCRLTISSDASLASPRNLFEQIRACVLRHGFPLQQVLALATSNAAKVLKLDAKGGLEAGKDADLVILRKDSFEIKDVIARGRRMMKDGRLTMGEKFLEESNRKIRLDGKRR